jgi:hypothetical protein
VAAPIIDGSSFSLLVFMLCPVWLAVVNDPAGQCKTDHPLKALRA